MAARGGVRRPESELEAIEFALDGVPLHPEYTYLWDDIAPADIVFLANRISAEGRIGDGGLSVPNAPEVKAILEELLVPHHLAGDGIVVPEYWCSSPVWDLRCSLRSGRHGRMLLWRTRWIS